jgi:hypothetical protein
MATFTAQRMNMSDGFTPQYQRQEERIALAGSHLVLLLKEVGGPEISFGLEGVEDF